MRRLLHPYSLIYRQRDRWRRAIRRHRRHVDAGEIRGALQRLGEVETPALMIHSSLSACGQIDGGALTVIEALRAWSRPALLAMPAHSYLYPRGNRPAPCFHPDSSPSKVGMITNVFRQQPGVTRSLHPTHSLACEGPGARELCSDHDWSDTPCGRGTPYDKLLQGDCAVLMFGATLTAYTFFHTAEDAANVAYLYQPRPCELALCDALGIRWSLPSLRHDMGVTRRFGEMDAWLEERGLLRRGRLGLGELLFIPSAAAVHRTLLQELLRNPWLLVAESARPAGVARA